MKPKEKAKGKEECVCKIITEEEREMISQESLDCWSCKKCGKTIHSKSCICVENFPPELIEKGYTKLDKALESYKLTNA